MKKSLMFVLFCALFLVVTGCGNKSESTSDATKSSSKKQVLTCTKDEYYYGGADIDEYMIFTYDSKGERIKRYEEQVKFAVYEDRENFDDYERKARSYCYTYDDDGNEVLEDSILKCDISKKNYRITVLAEKDMNYLEEQFGEDEDFPFRKDISIEDMKKNIERNYGDKITCKITIEK